MEKELKKKYQMGGEQFVAVGTNWLLCIENHISIEIEDLD